MPYIKCVDGPLTGHVLRVTFEDEPWDDGEGLYYYPTGRRDLLEYPTFSVVIGNWWKKIDYSGPNS